MRVAAARYPIERIEDFEAFAAKQARFVDAARAAGARLLVMPEYLGMELASAIDGHAALTPAALALAVASFEDRFRELFATLAERAGIAIVAGSFLAMVRPGVLRNRSTFFAPGRAPIDQDKLALTRFERELGCLEPGDALGVVEWRGLRVGIAVCYDIEFPLPVRAQVEAGARLIVVPSSTDTAAGAARVRTGCAARALENQVYVLKAVTTGDAPFNAFLDANTGEPALHAPIDRGFPDDGVVVKGVVDSGPAAGLLAIADLDLDALAAVRRDGQVGNDADWPAQRRPCLRRARVFGAD
jgi:predicted amidohydrolase